MKCLRCHQDNPSQAKFCLECGTPADGVASSHADLKAELEGLKSSLGESLEQQTATAEILRVIGSSPTDVQPVFATIVRSAARLCGGVWSMVFRVDGDMLDVAAAFPGRSPAVDTFRRFYRMRISDPTLPMWRTPMGRAMREQIVVQTPDVLSEPDMTEDVLALAREVGFRTSSLSPCSTREQSSEFWVSHDPPLGPSPIGKSSSCRPSPPKRSSRSRTSASSTRRRRP